VRLVSLTPSSFSHLFKLKAPSAKSRTLSESSSSSNGEETESEETRAKVLKQARSEGYTFIAKGREQRKEAMTKAFADNSSNIANLQNVLKGAEPKGWEAKGALILVGIGAKALLEDLELLNGAGLFKALFQRDKSLLYTVMLRGVVLAFIQSCLNAYTKYFQNKLQVDLLESLTKKFMKKYIGKAGFYGLKNIDGRM
jgi:ABC-type uncharacterized transport system fused permease/ATPase subunit